MAKAGQSPSIKTLQKMSESAKLSWRKRKTGYDVKASRIRAGELGIKLALYIRTTSPHPSVALEVAERAQAVLDALEGK